MAAEAACLRAGMHKTGSRSSSVNMNCSCTWPAQIFRLSSRAHGLLVWRRD